jgi:hypothetical protein
MKVGDKLICKKDIITEFPMFLKGKKFLIHKILDDDIWIISMTVRTISIKKKSVKKCFYTQKDIRKQKLDKINENK